jgi:hypothetical protein
MGSLLPSTPYAAALAGALVVALLGLGTLVGVLLRMRGRASADRAAHAALVAELARGREDVDVLARRVGELAEEVDRARADAALASRDREYVITSLGELGGPVDRPGPLAPPRVRVARALEDRVVAGLARRRTGSPVRARAVDVVVRTVALGHGVRRALTPDVLDRAAAESHVARRRSRRVRRQELRDARRLVRAVRAQDRAGERREDVA